MQVFKNSNGSYEVYGVSGETKPVGTYPPFTRFHEMNTGKEYYYNDASQTWPEVGADASPVTPVSVTVNIPAAAVQADSEAETVAELVEDFNGLLAKLKAAGLMAEE